jgi:hypothetical protein
MKAKQQATSKKKNKKAHPKALTRKTNLVQEMNLVPIESVAAIAANLLQRTSVTPAEATSMAFELLEIAAAGQRGLVVHSDWQCGIDELLKRNKAWADWIANNVVPDISQLEDGETRKHTPLPDVLKALMPDARSVKTVDHEPRLRRWIMDAHDCDNFRAADILASWKRDGVPKQAFQHLRLTWAKWWRESKSEVRREPGRKGNAARRGKQDLPKGKQGCVKRKTDKRLGAKQRDGLPALLAKIKKPT